MSLRCNKVVRSVQVAVFVLGAVLMHRAEASPVLKVCLDQTNPTHEMDARVATAAAQTQGYTIHKEYFIGHGKLASDAFPVKRFAELAQSKCQIIMGFPVDVDDPHLPPNVKGTQPYASTGFILVGRGTHEPGLLDKMSKGTEVGIAELDTWAGLLFTTHPNITMYDFPSEADMLDGLEDHKINTGMAWQPFFEEYKEKHSKSGPMSFHFLAGKHLIWNLVALYAPGSQAAAEVFEKGVATLKSKGELEKLIQPYRTAQPEPATDEQTSAAVPQNRVASNVTAGRLIKVADKKDATKPKPPAMYTEAQASKGRVAYLQNCGMCHGPQLGGQEAGFVGPALKGADFADPSYDFHVSDIFNFVSKLMPAPSPGSLTQDQYTGIMAFILQQNGYPAGSKALSYAEAEKSNVPMLYYGK